MFLAVFDCLSVCLSVRTRICMNFLPEVCLRPSTKGVNFGNDSDHAPDPGSGLRSGLHRFA